MMNNVTTPEITPELAERLLDDVCEIAVRASAAILAVPPSEAEQRTKDDQSPVTKADKASERIILEGLADLSPGIPIISEESADSAPPRIEMSCYIVDPLDGTKEFLAGRDEYTVCIGLVTRGRPIAGVIAAPKQGFLWRGAIGKGAERLRTDFATGALSDHTAIHTRQAPDSLVAALSRTHLDENSEAFLSRLKISRRYSCGSAVKFCHLAQGDADIYPRLSPTCEWDIAAGCAILAAAGGKVTNPKGGELGFAMGAKKFRVPGFIAWGDPSIARLS
jgi:3'(2'), 5'-bisphosphate nucleotidase